jgi:hypothetical protein
MLDLVGGKFLCNRLSVFNISFEAKSGQNSFCVGVTYNESVLNPFFYLLLFVILSCVFLFKQFLYIIYKVKQRSDNPAFRIYRFYAKHISTTSGGGVFSLNLGFVIL